MAQRHEGSGEPANAPDQELFTAAQVARRWGVSLRTIRTMVATHELDAVRIGRRLVRIPATAVHALERPYADGPAGVKRAQREGTAV